MRTTTACLCLAAVWTFNLLEPAGSAHAVDTFEITRQSADAGGGRSTGGAFDLSGTVGQAEHSTAAGGTYSLSGGFWITVPPADCNEDGLVSLADFDAYESCLAGPSTPAPAACTCFDVDTSFSVDLRDYALLQQELTLPPTTPSP